MTKIYRNHSYKHDCSHTHPIYIPPALVGRIYKQQTPPVLLKIGFRYLEQALGIKTNVKPYRVLHSCTGDRSPVQDISQNAGGVYSSYKTFIIKQTFASGEFVYIYHTLVKLDQFLNKFFFRTSSCCNK